MNDNLLEYFIAPVPVVVTKVSPLIESMYFAKGVLPLWEFHIARLRAGFMHQAWPLNVLEDELLKMSILEEAKNYDQLQLKVRLVIDVRVISGKSQLHWDIQMEDWYASSIFEQPFELDFYDATSTFAFANTKSVEAIDAYQSAKKFAKQIAISDVIVRNSAQEIVDTTLANVFLIKDGCIFTNSLRSGAVAGVMRAYLMHLGKVVGYPICTQDFLSTVDVLQADAVFLTNAVRGIIPVAKVGVKRQNIDLCLEVKHEIEQLLFTIQ